MKRFTISLFVLSIAATANAQNEAEATRLYAEGQTLMSTGRLNEACTKFEGSLKAGGGIGTMLYLGTCYERTSRPSSAYAMYAGAASLAHTRNDSREATATDLAQKIKDRVSWLVLHFKGSRPIGYELRRDATLIADDELERPIPVDPGEHTLDARAPGKTSWQTTFKVEGEGLTIIGDVLSLVDAPKPPPIVITKSSGSTQRALGVVVMGTGVASIVVGSILGVTVLQSQGETTDPKSPHYCNDAANPPWCLGGESFRRDAQNRALAADVLFVVGGAAMLGGAIVYFTAPKKPSTTALRVGPQGASFHWTF